MLQVSNPLSVQQAGGGIPAALGVAQAGASQPAVSSVLFPTASPQMAAPAAPVAQPAAPPAAKPTVKKATTPAPAPVAQPAAPPQMFMLGGQQVSYDPNTNQASIVQQQTQEGTAQPVDPNQNLATLAAQGGLSVDDYTKIIGGQSGVSTQDQQRIRDSLGIDALQQSLFTPGKSSEQIYQDAFNAAGLANVKTKFDDIQAKINKAHEDLTTALGTVNENPWLSEASRVGRAKRLQDLGSEQINNLATQAQQYADQYNQGLSQVHDVVTRANQDFTDNQNLNAAKLTYLEQKAQDQIAAQQAENTGKLSRYLPDFLAAKAKANKPDTITAGDGSVLAWNPATGKFDQVSAPKPVSPVAVSQGSVLIDPASGQVLFHNPAKVTAGGPGGTSAVSSALQQAIISGLIDPNKINSRTLPIYEAIAGANINAVSAHAGANAQTNAYDDTYKIVTTQGRLIKTVDSTMPLVANLADTVNTTGIPGLDNYVNGVQNYTGNDPKLGQYINSLKAIRTEYANMLSKGAVPTESDKASAADAIPAGKSGDYYRALMQQMNLEGQNIIQAGNQTLQGIFTSGQGSNVTQSNSNPLSLPGF